MRSVAVCFFLFLGSGLSAQNRFSKDLQMKVIYNSQYRNQYTGLLSVLKNPDEKYAIAACLAFASIQDSILVPDLMAVLKSEAGVKVKQAAVYSLGQLRLNSVSKLLIEQYRDKKNKAISNDLLMAIGKGANPSDTLFFSGIKLKLKDTAQVYAYAYSVFQAYRKKYSSQSIIKTLKKIQSKNKREEIQILCRGVLPSLNLPPVIRKDNMPPNPGHPLLADIDRILSLDNNPYHLLDQMKNPRNMILSVSVLDSMAFSEKYPHAIRTHCMETLMSVKSYTDTLNLDRLFSSGNISFISLASEFLRNNDELISRNVYHVRYLKRIQNNLRMPGDFETWVDLEKLICKIDEKPYQYQSWFSKMGYEYPIDWAAIEKIPETQKVRIVTNKGVIVLQCLVNEAPVSVHNFLREVDSGFYNGKYFHRMVPSFVVQGGCPRGDGWGALNWLQKSEFSNQLKYKPGSVGLASSGKDSEGVQFFITHTYTPHLDGRYTIFAEVIQGMEVVNQLLVGDTIILMERMN